MLSSLISSNIICIPKIVFYVSVNILFVYLLYISIFSESCTNFLGKMRVISGVSKNSWEEVTKADQQIESCGKVTCSKSRTKLSQTIFNPLISHLLSSSIYDLTSLRSQINPLKCTKRPLVSTNQNVKNAVDNI